LSLREGPFGDIRPSILWVAGLALAVAGIVAAGIYFSDHSQSVRPGPYGAARRSADSVAAPAGGVLSTPFQWLDHGVGWVGDYVAAGSENHDLKTEVIRQRRWRDIAMALQLENARLRALMGVRTDPPIPMVVGQTVLEARGPFSNARLVDVGAARGVTEGNPVLSDHGLVGRVVGVAPRASRILMLTDVESRVPVLLPRTNGRAILTGDGGANPTLAFLRAHDALRPGDRVLTSGDGGVFPRGLPVGSVVRGFDGDWRVSLDSDEAPVDFVQILLFTDFSQLAPPAGLAPTTLPTTATAPPPPPPPVLKAPEAIPPTGAGKPAPASPVRP
jgi:rod shape-determining protein MreC